MHAAASVRHGIPCQPEKHQDAAFDMEKTHHGLTWDLHAKLYYDMFDTEFLVKRTLEIQFDTGIP